MPEVITDNLGLWTSALLTKSTAGRGSNGKLEAHGIKKLRELIYELAAKGLLVDVTGYAAAKTAKIGDVADLVMGQAPPGNECNKDGIGTIFVKTGEFGELYPEVVEWTTKPLKLAKAGDVLICVVGATVGKLNLAIDCAIGRSVAAIRPHRDIDTKYLYFSLMPYTLKLRSQSRGSAQGVIGKEELNAVEIRLPSLKEQHRIVAKVDELMALCDQLEQQQTHSIAAHQTLVETLLGALTRVESQQEFSAAWARIASYFDTLFTTEASIDQLKQTILQLAVMGKLVPQDPTDEPASVLLEKIAEEKKRMTEDGLIKKQITLSSIEDDEKPLTLPEGWECVRFGTVAVIERGGSPRPIDSYLTNDPDGLNWIKIGDTDQGGKYITSTSEKIRREGLSKTRMVYPGDFLLTNSMSFGRPYITKIEGCIHDGWLRISPPNTVDKDYLYLLLSSPYIREAFKVAAAGAVVQNLNADKVRELVIPIPPINEQHRIVAKVDELMALCDTLKARLAGAQAIQLHLADAIVEQAVC